MLDYNYLVRVPSGFQPRINQYIFDNCALEKPHINVHADDAKYIYVDRVDYNNIAKVYRKLSLPFNVRKTAIQQSYLQK